MVSEEGIRVTQSGLLPSLTQQAVEPTTGPEELEGRRGGVFGARKDDGAILEDLELLRKAAFLTPSLVPTEQPATPLQDSPSREEVHGKLGGFQGEVCKP